MELPELPEPDREEVLIYSERFDGTFDTSKWFTADQMRSYGLSCARAAMERAAQVCDGLTVALDNGGNKYRREAAASRCAAAIRAEIEKEPT